MYMEGITSPMIDHCFGISGMMQFFYRLPVIVTISSDNVVNICDRDHINAMSQRTIKRYYFQECHHKYCVKHKIILYICLVEIPVVRGLHSFHVQWKE